MVHFLGHWPADSFVILFILFVIAVEFAEKERVIAPEMFFMIYALGFTLEKVATMQEHGIHGLYQTIKLLGCEKLKLSSLFQGDMGMFLGSIINSANWSRLWSRMVLIWLLVRHLKKDCNRLPLTFVNSNNIFHLRIPTHIWCLLQGCAQICFCPQVLTQYVHWPVVWAYSLGMDVLALIACLMFPRWVLF